MVCEEYKQLVGDKRIADESVVIDSVNRNKMGRQKRRASRVHSSAQSRMPNVQQIVNELIAYYS
jgi:hypothetical protein